ncbi:site-2 protease family protein [Myxococcota bacterium]|nr:site-2 protease family protein [Myxococcota bacterium]
MNFEDIALAAIWYPVFLLSTVAHEAAHSLAAKIGGDNTAFDAGQVSLNPIPHIQREPFGMVVVPWISFFVGGWMLGWASTPYDPRWARAHPKRAAWMSLAGPGANLAFVVLAVILLHLGLAIGIFEAPQSINFSQLTVATNPAWTPLAQIVSVIFTLNLVLFVFNLIPLPPLDGAGALPLFISPALYRRYEELFSNSTFAIIGLVVAWNIFGPIFSVVHIFAINLLYPGITYG